jgi:hypothetical protein
MNIQKYFIFLLLTIPITSISQSVAPTTPEEYAYGVTGYKLQLQMNLAMKKGYSISELGTCEESDRKLEFKELIRDGETKPCAIILVYSRLRHTPQYHCIPVAGSDPLLFEKFYNSLITENENQQQKLQFFSYCMGKIITGLSGD